MPSCPGWTFAQLVLHVGRFLQSTTAYLTSGSTVPLPPLAPPAEVEPLTYLDEQLAVAAEILPTVPRNRPVWTFSPAAPDLAWVWLRRIAHELTLRRWDAQTALVALVPTDRDQAVDGVDEVLGTILAARTTGDVPSRARGTALVSCGDGPETWLVRFTPGEVPAVSREAAAADARLTASASSLFYQLWGRLELAGEGDPAVLGALRAG
ncbi:maleylpyruvate isomerase N-terminal domain-containing protein [Kutzneria sp. CA-103260]|uniref:maleylpyruvate isomerase N-terminal domain-containing protein n=1 Tax=Kutzneria sp. CA-103260 TaxID=2802641 RepID=UPI001BEDAA8A|nr:maleylpyruvate isomerase N-terminal domain-containing protein [Kutzneria sp. CA-103260]QUQ62328.1 maleylpyruvate isomerase family mycothiol-dependent enzyme [Kutzneria sp. CA-103260]